METQNERLLPATPDKPKARRRPGILSTAIAAFSAALLSVSDRAKAQDSSGTADDDIGTEFPADVNVRDGMLGVVSATLSPGNASHRFEMLHTRKTFQGYDIYKVPYELDDGPNGEVILRQLGDVRPVEGLTVQGVAEEKAIQIRRSDGTPTTVAYKGSEHTDSGLFTNGSLRWDDRDSENDCGGLDPTYGGISTFNPLTRRLYIAAAMQGLPMGYQMLQPPIDAPNYCHWARDAIAEATREQRPLDQTGAGIFDRRIAGPGSAFLYSRTFANWQRNLAAIFRTPNNLTWPPDPAQAHTLVTGVDSNGNNTHLEVTIDSDVWAPENPQRGTQDDVLGVVWDTHAFKTRSGRDIALMITDKRGFLDAVAAVPQPDGSFLRVPVILDRGAEPDSDGDSIIDALDTCYGRADPANTDTNGDGQGDACSMDCGNAFPETPIADVPPSQIDANGLRICTDETGEYAFARSDDSGSSLKTTNAPVTFDANGDISLQPGQDAEYIHSCGPNLQCTPSRKIILPPGNSARAEIFSTAHLDGTPGSGYVAYQPYDPNAAPVRVEFNGPTEIDIPVQAGGEIGLEGSHARVSAGTENLPLTCPPRCVTEPDGGTSADGGEPADSGQPDGNLPVNDGGGTPDACPTCDPDGGETKPDANEIKPDGGTSNADAGAEAKPDSGQTETPAKPCGGCNTTGAAGSAILVSVIAAMRRRREKVLGR